MFDDLRNAVGVYDSVMYDTLAPSIAVGYAVVKDNALTIYGVRPLPFTLENTIAGVNTIARNEGIGQLTEVAVRAKQQGVRCYRIKASATREGKECYNHTQCQGESQ